MCLWLGWLGCVRRVGMYWKEGEKRNYTILSLLFVTLSSLVHEKILWEWDIW